MLAPSPRFVLTDHKPRRRWISHASRKPARWGQDDDSSIHQSARDDRERLLRLPIDWRSQVAGAFIPRYLCAGADFARSQDQGWKMFTSWVEHAITPSGCFFLPPARLRSSSERNADSPPSPTSTRSKCAKWTRWRASSSPRRSSTTSSSCVPSRSSPALQLNLLAQFSPTDLISLDDWVFNTEAHPFRIPKSHSSPARFWTGPDEDAAPTSSFASTMGEGTIVQKWARVRQAAVLAKAARVHDVPPPEGRTPIRPTEEELEKARGKGVDIHAFAKEKMEQDRGGGGRGMGGGGRRPA